MPKRFTRIEEWFFVGLVASVLALVAFPHHAQKQSGDEVEFVSAAHAVAGPDLTVPVTNSVETDHVITADAGAGFTCGRYGDGGYFPDSGPRPLVLLPTKVPCPDGTKLIHVRVPAGLDGGGEVFGGSAVRYDDSPIIRGAPEEPTLEYTANRTTLYCKPKTAPVLGTLFMCGR